MEESSNNTYEVKLRELQSLLRKKLGDDLIVVDYRAESLLPLGENFGSTILKVRATVKGRADAEEEVMSFVAKMLPTTQMQREMFDSSYSFKKELYMYEHLIPAYQCLEKELGVGEDDVLDVLPELYGARFSLLDNDAVDDDAVILMQNLNAQGYYMGDKRVGLDLPHAEAAIAAIARFHALGIATKMHKPDLFEEFKVRSKCIQSKDGDFSEITQFYVRLMQNDEEMSKYKAEIEDAMGQDILEVWMGTPPEPWATIVHTDFWINNFMFKNDDSGIHVKIVDFQNYLLMSPLRELVFFLMVNLRAEIMQRDFEKLIDHYYASFVRVLRRMKCDVEPFRREKFDERLKIDAYNEFMHIPFMLKVMTADFKDESQVTNVRSLMVENTVNSRFLEKLRMAVEKYAENGWFHKQDQ